MGNSQTVSRDDFENWLCHMDDEIEALFQSIPEDLKKKLDFSVESLLDLEAYLLSKYPDIEAVRATGERENLDRYFRYVGETIRKVAGGKWDIELDDQADAYWRIPVLRSNKYGSSSPLTTITASLDRRRGNFIYSAAKRRLELAEKK